MVAWVTKKGYDYHKKFHRVLGMDTTNGTNKEKRGLAKIVGKTSLRGEYGGNGLFSPEFSIARDLGE